MSGEIPAKEGSCLIARRVSVLVKQARVSETCKDKHKDKQPAWMVRSQRRRARKEDMAAAWNSGGQLPGANWVNSQRWDIPKHHTYQPLPWQMYHCRASVAALEVRSLSKLLAQGADKRAVLWQVVEVASMIAGPDVSTLLGDAISSLHPKNEGMARCIARHYPYLNCALTKGQKQDGSPDVLSPLLELWLLDDKTRDKHAGKIMERGDYEYFLFFGVSFARHLSNARQEWLHRCLLKLKPSGEDVEPEFFHYPRRGPVLRQLAQLRSGSKGWRQMLKQAEGLDERGIPSGVQMYLWHPDTQTKFLEKALAATDHSSLSLIPRADHADSVARVSQVLDKYPREQTVREAGVDLWGWEVIQAAGAYSDVSAEVERRFSELVAPWVCDAVDDAQVEVLLTALGRSDNAAKAMAVLGKFAGKVKQAKEAVIKMISQVSPPRARGLIRDVMLPKAAGVGLQVAGLKKIVELQIPNPLDLYKAAWRKGYCQRDVAGNILAKVATSPEFAPEDVRMFFDFFELARNQADQAETGRTKPRKQDDQVYVAEVLLDQLASTPEWTLPFLPEVVAKLALLPSVTKKATTALLANTSNPTEVVKALTEVSQLARLALRTEPTARDADGSTLLKDLKDFASLQSVYTTLNTVNKMRLDECEPTTLLAYVMDVLQAREKAVRLDAKAAGSHDLAILNSGLTAWANFLRSGQESRWPSILAEMETHLMHRGAPQSLVALAQAVVARVPKMDLGTEEYNAILATVGAFFQRLLSGPMAVAGAPSETGSDNAFRKHLQDKRQAANTLVQKHWVGLLIRGCLEAETSALFTHCPKNGQIELATALVEGAVRHEKKVKADFLSAAPRQARRPDEGWAHTGGFAIESVEVGSVVSGSVTNSSGACGVFVNFGCVRDGKLNVPGPNDWKKYRVGDRVERMLVNKCETSCKTGTAFIELLPVDAGRGVPLVGATGKDVARRAVKWLASSPNTHKERWDSVSTLWASVIALESDKSGFEKGLPLLGETLPPLHEMIGLVEKLLAEEVNKSVVRSALTWLGERSPQDAVRLWPALLTPNAGDERVEAKDVETLLALCESGGFKLPPIRKVVALGISDEVIDLFRKSALPEARLVVVQALQERQCSVGEQRPPVLDDLLSDPCHVVRVAARVLWTALGGREQELEKSDDESSGNED